MLRGNVRQVMTRNIYAVSPETDLSTAARLLVTQHIGGAPVIDGKGRVIGVVTLNDLADPDRGHSTDHGESMFYRLYGKERHAIGDGGDPTTAGEGVVADVMSPYVLAIAPDASLADAARVMVNDDVHRLLVLEGEKLVGIVSSMDILRALARPANPA